MRHQEISPSKTIYLSLSLPQHENFCSEDSASKLAQAAEQFADLESALNAEIFAEEIGILRRYAAHRRNS